MADDDPLFQDLPLQGSVHIRDTGLGEHLLKGLLCHGKIVCRSGIAGGEGRIHVFEVRQIDIHISPKPPKGIDPFIAAAVQNDGNGEAVPDPVQGMEDIGQPVGGGHQIDVLRPFSLQPEKDIGKGIVGDLPAKAAVADLMILAEDAAQGAA